MAASRSKVIFILLAIYFAVRLPWLYLVPMVEAPDEFSHFWVLKFMAEHCRLPEASEIFQGGPSAVYGSYPPMGYLNASEWAQMVPMHLKHHLEVQIAKRNY